MQNSNLIVGMVDVLELNLSGITGKQVPLVDIYLNDELYQSDIRVTAKSLSGESMVVALEGDFSELQSLRVQFKNDAGIERVDINSITFNGNKIDLSQGTMVRSNGDVHEGLTKMYWNGSFTLDAEALNAQEYSIVEEPAPAPEPVPGTQLVEIDLSAVIGGVTPEANIYINGELVEAKHKVTALTTKGQSETLSYELNGEMITSVQVEFLNDDGPSRIDLLHVRVNNNEVNLADSLLTRSNGDVHEGLTKMYWNGKISVSVPDEYNVMTTGEPAPAPAPEAPVEVPTEEVPNEETPEENTEQPVEEQPVEEPVEEIPTETPPATGNGTDWGGIDPNMYRGNYAGRDSGGVESYSAKIASDGADGKTLHIATGTSASAIMKMIAAADQNEHLTLDFAAGEHWFNEQLLIERGDITMKGAGEGKTVFVANFANFDVQNLIQIQGDDIRLDNGSNNGRWRADQSDYVGTATKNFSLGDRELSVSSTKGLSIGDHVMVFKEGTSSKTDGDDEFGTIAEITGINGSVLSFKHSLAFGSNLLATGESLADVKVYELDLLENVNVHDFSVRYHVTDKDVYNPYKMPMEDILNSTEFNYFPKYAVGGKSVGEVGYGNQRALVLSGTHEANIHNVSMEDVGSHAFFFSGNLELLADNLKVDGVYNKGVDGNGYGIEYDKTYYSDFLNLDITNVRHGVSANILGGNGFNNFHVKHTDSNLDFHGGRDQANIYYIEDMEYKAHWLPKIINGKLSGDLNYGYGKSQFELINYRQDVNVAENTVIWKNVIGNGSPNNNGSVYDLLGEKLSASLHANDDFLVAGNIGSNINAGFGNDILVAGKGNDILTGGKNAGGVVHKDMFVFDAKSGKDIVTDFEAGNDKIVIHGVGSTLKSVGDVLKFVSQSGSNAVLDFGDGNTVTLMNTDASDLNTGNVQMLMSDVTDLF